jgi:hypothetical protein
VQRIDRLGRPVPEEIDFSRLSDEARQAIPMVVLMTHGLNMKEVAQLTGLSYNEVTSQLKRLRAELRPPPDGVTVELWPAGTRTKPVPPPRNGHGSPRRGTPVPDFGEPVWGEVEVSWTEPTVPPGTREARLRAAGKLRRRRGAPRPKLKVQAERRCAECGETFAPAASNQAYCDKTCGKRAANRRWSQRQKARRSAAS